VSVKTATYKTLDGKTLSVHYDETAPCNSCGLPITTTLVSNPTICTWCDAGLERPEKKTRSEFSICFVHATAA
jgi:hypothetical protein